jgi:hypothetical protein
MPIVTLCRSRRMVEGSGTAVGKDWAIYVVWVVVIFFSSLQAEIKARNDITIISLFIAYTSIS